MLATASKAEHRSNPMQKMTRRAALRGTAAAATCAVAGTAAVAAVDTTDAYLEHLANEYWRIEGECNAAMDRTEDIGAEAQKDDPEAFGVRDGHCFPIVCLFARCNSLHPTPEQVAEYAGIIFTNPPIATQQYEERLLYHLEHYGERCVAALERYGWLEAHRRYEALREETSAAHARAFEAKANGLRGILAKYRVIYTPGDLDEMRSHPAGAGYMDEQGHASVLRDLERLVGEG
jgi:hypothetical protein